MKAYALQLAAVDGFEDWPTAGGRGEPADYCSQEGAHALKATIEAYWAERGQNVMVALHNVGFHPAIRAARYDVRSDMINGKPRAGSNAARKLHEVNSAEDDERAFE